MKDEEKVSASKRGEKGLRKDMGTQGGESEYVSGLEASAESDTKLLLELRFSLH